MPTTRALLRSPRRRSGSMYCARLGSTRPIWSNAARRSCRDFPDRIVPVSPKAAEMLKKRTLTNLYNERPAWLDNALRELDAAVAAAYGWPADIGEEDALARLLDLTRERAAAVADYPSPRPSPRKRGEG